MFSKNLTSHFKRAKLLIRRIFNMFWHFHCWFGRKTSHYAQFIQMVICTKDIQVDYSHTLIRDLIKLAKTFNKLLNNCQLHYCQKGFSFSVRYTGTKKKFGTSLLMISTHNFTFHLHFQACFWIQLSSVHHSLINTSLKHFLATSTQLSTPCYTCVSFTHSQQIPWFFCGHIK